jgi:hypothetical protein
MRRSYVNIVSSQVIALPYSSSYQSLLATLMHFCNRCSSSVLFAYQRRHSSEDEFFDLLRTKFDVVRYTIHLIQCVSYIVY